MAFDFNTPIESHIRAEGPSAPAPAVQVGEDGYTPFELDGVVFPRLKGAELQALAKDSPQEYQEWLDARYAARTDPIVLARMLGMDLQEDPHRVLFHNLLTFRGPKVPLADLAKLHRRLLLWSRGHAKTSAVRCLCVQALLNYHNLRVCFLTGRDSLARDQLAAVKSFFEDPTPEFLRLFPEYCLKSIKNRKTGKWEDRQLPMGTTQKFSTPARNTKVFPEPNFFISTPKSIKTGQHMDILCIDDAVNDQNYQSPPALEKCYQQYIDACPLLDPSGFIWMTGTVYSHRDTYARIQERAKEAGEYNMWHVSIHDCWSKGICATCGKSEIFHDKSINILQPPGIAECGCNCPGFVPKEQGVVFCLFPRARKANGEWFGFTVEGLLQQKADMGESKFANQYECRPTAQGRETFTQEMIGAATIFERKDLPPAIADTFVVGDLAFSTEDDSDQTVLFVFKRWMGALWLIHCAAGHWASNELVENTLRIIRDFHPRMMFYEKGQASDSLNSQIIARSREFGVFRIPITWISYSHAKDAKLIRVSGVQTWLVGKRLKIFAGMPHFAKLVQQLLDHPRSGGHDDFADCCGMCCEVPLGLEFEPTTEQQQQESGNWLHRLNPAQEPELLPGQNDGSSFAF